MRIANIMLGGRRGGLEQALLDSSEALCGQGHEVTAFIRTHAAVLPDLMRAHIPTVSLPMPYPWNLWHRLTLGRRLRQFDLILLHGNRAGDLTRIRRLPPTLAVVHSRFFNARPHFTALLALTQERAKELNTPYVVPNMVRIPAAVSRGPFREPPVIGAMGRLSPEKGFDLLLDAFALLRQRHIAFRAVIAGVGDEAETLQRRAAQLHMGDAVQFVGWVDDKAAFFAGIDLFVLSSRTENFPITLLEAMAHACPIVATRCGGPQLMVKHGTGRLADISAEAIADAMAKALQDEAGTRAGGEAARTLAREQYAMDVVGKQLSAIAAEVAARR